MVPGTYRNPFPVQRFAYILRAVPVEYKREHDAFSGTVPINGNP
jgi:hypothetical protein